MAVYLVVSHYADCAVLLPLVVILSSRSLYWQVAGSCETWDAVKYGKFLVLLRN